MKEVELKGCGIKGAKYEWKNFTPARVSWSQGVERLEEEAPYEYREEVRVLWEGEVVLVGTIRKCSLEQSGSAWRWCIEACDVLQPLEGALCFDELGALRSSAGRRVTLGSSASGDYDRKVQVVGVLERLLGSAQRSGLLRGVKFEVNVDESAWMWDTSLGCDVYAGLLRKVLGERPGLVCWVDYSGGECPVIRVDDGGGLPSAVLDRVEHRLGAVSLSARPDLVPPAVGVVITGGKDGVVTQVYPDGSDLRQEGCVTTQVAAVVEYENDEDTIGSEAPVWNFTKQVVEVRGEALPVGTGAAAKKWWVAQIPKLSGVQGLGLGVQKRTTVPDVEGCEMDNYSADETAQRYRHVSGQLSEKCKTIKWSYIELQQVVYTDTKPPKGLEMVFNRTPVVYGGKLRYWGWVTWKGRTINTNRRKYRVSKSGESGADGGGDVPVSGNNDYAPSVVERDYRGVLQAYWEATRDVPWEGNVTALVPLSPSFLVGKRLGITGLRAEYIDMATIVQGVSIDLFSRQTFISTGVPDHLSLQDMLDRVRKYDSNQQELDDEQQNTAAGLTLEYDNEAYQSPEAPTLSPEGGVVWAESQPLPSYYGFQVVAEREMGGDDDTITGCRIRPGKIMLNGSVIATVPQGSVDGWYRDTITNGEIWLDVIFTKDGMFDSAVIMCEQGVVEPLVLGLSKDDERTEPYRYSFHLATINGNEVIQHILGTIQIPVVGGTFYPYGPAV